ncbi:sulfite oxidase-like [Dendronephthya gigantea]|uniref:sulfite oxidase-like n=1 Tax=Dendronephthya gigantea TaxID=151771 RepID=UPI00106C04C6|nr:sulfite oxidase-like [Dendronephthya gigantea]
MLSLSRICRPFLTAVLQRCSSQKFKGQAARAIQTRTETKYSRNVFWGCAIAGSLGTGFLFLYGQDSLNAWSLSKENPSPPSSPLYSKEDVAKHNSPQNGIWVTYGGQVYDITEFVGVHPGGDKILLAAGGALEPFWAMYAVHQTDEVFKMLEEYCIGELKAEDKKSVVDTNDPYRNDPERHPSLVVRSKKPFNAETPLTLLGDSLVTPNSLFYVRNHLPVPEVDPKTYRLEVNLGNGTKPRSLSLDELKTKFKQHTLTVAIQCAGNRRDEMNGIKKVKGLTWAEGAIGNAQWTGVKLRDVLLEAGFKESEIDAAKHVQFEGMDVDVAKAPYGASVSLGKALDPQSDTLIAFAMNGEDIPKDHGYPVRIIIPGVVGARQVKWLNRIVIADEESRCHWQRNDYKGFSPSTDWDTVDFTSMPSIQDLPVQSAICEPANGAVLEAGTEEFTVKGYAWSGGGRGIVRVDVSPDGGKTWQIAELKKSEQPEGRAWGWTLWEAAIPVQNRDTVEVCCKAIDSSYNSQPENVAPIWNLRGVLSTAWHRVKVTVPPDEE